MMGMKLLLALVLIAVTNGSSRLKNVPIFSFGGLGGIISGGTNLEGNQIQSENHGCLFGRRKYEGTCTHLINCRAAISDQAAGIDPTLCSGRDYKGICCPTEPRIMCDKYKNVFRRSDSNDYYDYWCPLPHYAPRVFGGRNAVQKEFPHMVGLVWGSNTGNLDIKCGGTLISEKYVLTAAHCFTYPKIGPPSYVLLGDVRKDFTFRSSTRLLLKIKGYIIHPDRHPRYNDIALIQLEHKVNISDSIFPACLPSPTLRHEVMNTLTALGWGAPGQGRNTFMLFSHCCRFYSEPFPIVSSQFCATHPDRDTCFGDSGGPLTVSNDQLKCIFHVLGVTSFGWSCGYAPGVYTNVQYYLEWIEQIV